MAARIVGVDLPNKRIVIALTYVFGIGLPTSKKILEQVGIDENVRSFDLSEDELSKIRNIVREMNVEGDLRREIGLNIKRLIEINCFRGIRHRRGLPCRGQNTKNNARTRRGKKRLAVAGKKK